MASRCAICPTASTTAQLASISSGSSPDERGLAYIPPNDPNNIWVQPLGGGTARQITHFADNYQVNDFTFSPDGGRLAVTRSLETSDILLID